MRRFLGLLLAIVALLTQAPRAHADLPVVAWCVSSPGAADLCSADEERVLAAVRKRLDHGEGLELGGQVIVTRVQ